VLGCGAVILRWRLFWRSFGQTSGGAWVAVAAALLAAATMGQSAARLGEALVLNEIPRSQIPLTLGLWLWSTCLAAFAYALASGELPFIRNLLGDFAMRPISRGQAFLAMQMVPTAGPYALALPSIGLPWLILLVTWLDGTTLITAITATFVLMRLPAVLLSIGARVLSASLAIATVTVCAVLAALATAWLAAPAPLLAWSPPGLVVRILIDDDARGAWVGLAAWTLMVAAIEYWSMRLEVAPRAARVTPVQTLRPIPAVTTLLARLTGCPAALLDGELRRLARWRRYQLSWVMCAVLLAMIGSRLGDRPGLLLPLLFLLVPVHVGSSVLANLFATDRTGFHAFLMAPAGLRAVIRSKVVAILLFIIVAQAGGTAYLLVGGVAWPLVAAGVILAAGLFMSTAAMGLLTSAFFPSASDPHTVGGALVNAPSFGVLAIGGSLYLGPVVYLTYALETGRWSWPACAVAAGALVSATAVALVAASHLAPRVMRTRQEAMLFALSAAAGSRS